MKWDIHVLIHVCVSTLSLKGDIGIYDIHIDFYTCIFIRSLLCMVDFMIIYCVPRCEAPSGYIAAHNPFDSPLPADHVSHGVNYHRLDHNFCFSKDGMDLRLDGPNPMHLKQGDTYEEFGLQLSDSQPENFVRQVSIKYSAPFGAYFKEPATYEVSYTVQTPWMEDRTNITKIR